MGRQDSRIGVVEYLLTDHANSAAGKKVIAGRCGEDVICFRSQGLEDLGLGQRRYQSHEGLRVHGRQTMSEGVRGVAVLSCPICDS